MTARISCQIHDESENTAITELGKPCSYTHLERNTGTAGLGNGSRVKGLSAGLKHVTGGRGKKQAGARHCKTSCATALTQESSQLWCETYLVSSELVLGCLWGHGGCRLAGGWGGGGGGSGGGMALL